jgi:hypothetical protein
MKKNTIIILILLFEVFSSCKSKEMNYVNYYNKIYSADSIMRFRNDTIKALKQYRKTFRKFEPKNNERIKEFETFIKLSDKYKRNFGGTKNLHKLIKLNALNWEDKKKDKDFIKLNKKYGIDSLRIEREVNNWKTNLNKVLIDSFKIALERDQQGRHYDLPLVKKNVNKNASFLIWTFENYGFPTVDKIGWFPTPTFLSHMIESEKYKYFKEKIPEYIKKGECSPRDYAMLVDYGLQIIDKKEYTYYGVNGKEIIDSTLVNRNRKSIGLPSLKHKAKIWKDLEPKK